MSGNKSFPSKEGVDCDVKAEREYGGGKVQVGEGDEEEVGRGNSNAVLCLKKP